MYGFPLTIYLLVRFFCLSSHCLSTNLWSTLLGMDETGMLLGLFGEGVMHWPTIFSVTLFPLICIAYVMLARKEEAHMFSLFGEEYRRYHGQVPMFIARWGSWGRFASIRE